MKAIQSAGTLIGARRIQCAVSSLRRFLALSICLIGKRAVFLGFLFVFFLMGHLSGSVQTEQDTLRAKSIVAESFELLSPEGKTRASLSGSPEGGARLSFFDETG